MLVPTALLWIGQDLSNSRPQMRRWFPVRLAVMGTLLGVAIVVMVYLSFGARCYDYIYSGGRPLPRQLFLPLSTACIGEPYLRYTLFSGAHILDNIGAIFSIASPAAVLAILASFLSGRRDVGLYIFMPAIAFALLHNFILNPAIGFPFDWDLMCVVSPPILYTAVLLLARMEVAPRALLPGILFLGLGAATIFGVNASHERAYRRVEDMGVWLHRTYYGGSHYRLSSNLSVIADPSLQMKERERVLERLAPQTYPDDREIAFLWEKLAMMRIRAEDYVGAKEAYRYALAAQPSRWDREKPLGYLESEVGDLEQGMRLLNDYVGRAPGDGEAQLFLGDACARAGRTDEARRAWTRFLEIDSNAPEAPRVREDLRRLDAEVVPARAHP